MTDRQIEFFCFTDESTRKLRYRNELKKEMNQLVEDFYKDVLQQYTELRAQHGKERSLVLRCQKKQKNKEIWD